MLDYLGNRLKERSTWIGVIGLATSAGVGISPDNIESIATLGATFASLLAALIPDKK